MKTDPSDHAVRLALAHLNERVGRTSRFFRRLTGHSVVATIRMGEPSSNGENRLCPPVHPRCAGILRGHEGTSPCDHEWQEHVRDASRTQRTKCHVCPLGLRCACVAIHFGERLVGMAKLVVGPDCAPREFRLLVALLERLVAADGLELYRDVVASELAEQHMQVEHRNRVEAPWTPDSAPVARSCSSSGPSNPELLVRRALQYLEDHATDSQLSLMSVAAALRVSDKYLSHTFVQQTGLRMHDYVNRLRTSFACRLLIETDLQVKKIAVEVGFLGDPQFRRAFRQQTGVSPTEYRRVVGRRP